MSEPVTPADRRPLVFVSYSSHDAEAAGLIRAALEAAGHSTWMAPEDLSGSSPWPDQILSALVSCPVLLVVLSGHANVSPHVAREVSIAADAGKAIVPARVEAVEPEGTLRYLLHLVQWVDVFPPPVDDHRQALVRRIAAAAPTVVPATDAVVTLPVAPAPEAVVTLPAPEAVVTLPAPEVAVAVPAMPAPETAVAVAAVLVPENAVTPPATLAGDVDAAAPPPGSVAVGPQWPVPPRPEQRRSRLPWVAAALVGCLVLLALVVGGTLYLRGRSSGDVMVSRAAGVVTASRSGQPLELSRDGTSLQAGDVVSTGADGLAQVATSNGTVYRLSSNASARSVDVTADKADVALTAGRLWVQAGSQSAKVESPAGVLTVPANGVAVVRVADQTLTVLALAGTPSLDLPGKAVTLTAPSFVSWSGSSLSSVQPLSPDQVWADPWVTSNVALNNTSHLVVKLAYDPAGSDLADASVLGTWKLAETVTRTSYTADHPTDLDWVQAGLATDCSSTPCLLRATVWNETFALTYADGTYTGQTTRRTNVCTGVKGSIQRFTFSVHAAAAEAGKTTRLAGTTAYAESPVVKGKCGDTETSNLVGGPGTVSSADYPNNDEWNLLENIYLVHSACARASRVAGAAAVVKCRAPNSVAVTAYSFSTAAQVKTFYLNMVGHSGVRFGYGSCGVAPDPNRGETYFTGETSRELCYRGTGNVEYVVIESPKDKTAFVMTRPGGQYQPVETVYLKILSFD